jgi:GNAT superfamily N-acetyltransferase
LVEGKANVRLLKSFFYQLFDSIQIFTQKGMRAGFARLGQTVTRVFYVQGERVVLAKTLSGNLAALKLPPGLIIRRVLTKEDLASPASVVGPKDKVRFHQMFDQGSIAFIALQEGQPAGCGWISYQIDQRTNPAQAPLAPGDACLHDLFVAPLYRGHGIAQALVACRLQFLHKQGYKRSVISCSKGDTPALKVAQKAGYSSIGETRYTRFLFWNRLEYSPYQSEERYNV